MKNTASFTKDINDIIQPDVIMKSNDVISLFTNVPIKESLAIIIKGPEEDKTPHKHTKLLTENIMELLEFV